MLSPVPYLSKFRDCSPRRIAAVLSILALGWCAAGRAYASDAWTILTAPTDRDLNRLAFVDDSHGWVVGAAGTILQTADGGASWTAQACPVTEDVVDIRMLPGGTGWALSHEIGGFPWNSHSTVLKTVDQGENWVVQAEFDHLYWSLDFTNERHGLLVGDQGEIMITEDGGASWAAAHITDQQTALFSVREVQFHSPTFVLAMGGQYDVTGILWQSEDGGQNWTHTRVSGEPVFASHVFDDQNIVCMGGDLDYGAQMVRTSTGASGTWQYTDLKIWGQATAVAFRDDVEGWAPLGTAATYLYTGDGGATWTSMPSPASAMLNDVVFTSENVGYMAGRDGVILRYNGAGATGISVHPADGPSAVLFQNAPNPFPTQTQFAFRVAQTGPVSLKIYDLAGREVATVVNDELVPGEYTREFEVGPLASGVYYYRLTTPNTVQTRQMVILK